MRGRTVTVLRPVEVGRDAFNAVVVDWAPEAVSNVLFASVSTADLGEERPNGEESRLRLRFPSAYTATLRGCGVEALGKLWAVVGDPLQIPDSPLPWDREVEAVRVDG